MRKKVITFFCFFCIVFFCFFLLNAKEKTSNEIVIRMGYIPGMQGSALYLIDELDLIQKYIPNVKVELTRFESGVAVNEAFIANQLDIVEYSVPNFLIGVDKGISFKISSASNYMRTSLQTNDSSIHNLSDIDANDRIAVLSITGLPSILLQMAAKQQLGDYKALDSQIVTMNTEEAEMALINKAGITLHSALLASSIRENNAGCPTILTDEEILGKKCASYVNVTSVAFYEQYPELYYAYLTALEDAVNLINNKDEKAIEIIARKENMSVEMVLELLNSDNISFSYSTTYDIMPIMDFMHEIGLISNKPENLQSISFPNVVEK